MVKSVMKCRQPPEHLPCSASDCVFAYQHTHVSKNRAAKHNPVFRISLSNFVTGEIFRSEQKAEGQRTVCMSSKPTNAALGEKRSGGGILCQDSIARVAQTRDNIAVLVEVVIERAGIDFDIRMVLLRYAMPSGAATRTMSLMCLQPRFSFVDCRGSGSRRWQASGRQ